ncbi:hypothetical protein WMY93_028244 [Mugilogobius chulae]|uniref:BTB domain-containing protein n=1 Tax=Mugilogobius chulae TaxID=88201 RepID=A0AAW0MRD9_9GOBI
MNAMNAVRGGAVTWRPQPWQDCDGGGEPLSDSDSEEEDFPDDSTTPLGDYVTHGLKQLLDAQQLCDVTLLVEGKKFMCHRVLLAAVSPYFRAMFTSPLVESRLTEIRLEDVTPAVMDTVIRFVYSGRRAFSGHGRGSVCGGEQTSGHASAGPLLQVPVRALVGRKLPGHVLSGALPSRPSPAQSVSASGRAALPSRVPAEGLPAAGPRHAGLSAGLGPSGRALRGRGVRRGAQWAEHLPMERYAHMPALLNHLRPGLLSHEESRRLKQELGHAAVREALGGPLRPREECSRRRSSDLTVDCFDPRTGKWEKLAPLVSLVSPGCAAVGDRLFVAGGILRTWSVSPNLHEYDAVSDRWLERAPMSQPRAMLGLLACGNSLYALGGSNRNAFLDSSEVLDLTTMRWTNGPRLPLPLRAFACASLRSRLYLLGGTTLEQNRAAVHSGVLIYHTLTNCWTKVALDSGATCLAGGVAVRGGVCAIGGYMRDTTKFLDGNFTNLETLDATGRVLFFREGRGTEREVVVTNERERGSSDRAPSPVVFPGLPRRIAAGAWPGGRGGSTCWAERTAPGFTTVFTAGSPAGGAGCSAGRSCPETRAESVSSAAPRSSSPKNTSLADSERPKTTARRVTERV